LVLFFQKKKFFLAVFFHPLAMAKSAARLIIFAVSITCGFHSWRDGETELAIPLPANRIDGPI
jgi:hypothetical protein